MKKPGPRVGIWGMGFQVCMWVALVAEDVVQRGTQGGAAYAQITRLGNGLAHPVVMYIAVVYGFSLGVVGDFPELGDVFQGHDKAFTWGCVVHRRHARRLG